MRDNYGQSYGFLNFDLKFRPNGSTTSVQNSSRPYKLQQMPGKDFDTAGKDQDIVPADKEMPDKKLDKALKEKVLEAAEAMEMSADADEKSARTTSKQQLNIKWVDEGKWLAENKMKAKKRGSFSWQNVEVASEYVLSPVREQGKCGGCYAFAVLAACESLFKLQHQRDVRLSVQQIVDCIHQEFPISGKPEVDSHGCIASTTYNAYKYIAKCGVHEEAKYGYTSYKGDCNPPGNGGKLWIRGFEKLTGNPDEKMIQDLIRAHPITGVLHAYSCFQKLGKEVYQGPTSKSKLLGPHSVLIVGFGREKGIDFYWVKNCKGEGWGDKGYGKVKRSFLFNFAYPFITGWEQNSTAGQEE